MSHGLRYRIEFIAERNINNLFIDHIRVAHTYSMMRNFHAFYDGNLFKVLREKFLKFLKSYELNIFYF